MLHKLSLPNVSCLMPFITKIPRKSIFPGCQISRHVNPGQSNFLRYQFWAVKFPEIKLYMEVNFLGKSTFPESQLSREINFPGKSTFPGSQISRKVNFPGKSTFQGSQCSWRVNSKSKSQWTDGKFYKT